MKELDREELEFMVLTLLSSIKPFQLVAETERAIYPDSHPVLSIWVNNKSDTVITFGDIRRLLAKAKEIGDQIYVDK